MDKGRKNSYQRELDWFKANEMPECALLVDRSLLRFLVAWKRIDLPRIKRPPALPTRGKARIWRWLWRNVRFSMDDFAALSGASVQEATQKFNMLSGNAMVYPDGTLNTYVDRLLRAKTVLVFHKSQPSGQSKEEQRPKPAERR